MLLTNNTAEILNTISILFNDPQYVSVMIEDDHRTDSTENVPFSRITKY